MRIVAMLGIGAIILSGGMWLKDEPREERGKVAAILGVMLIVAYALSAAMIYFMPSPKLSTSAPQSEVMSYFGLEEGKAYPLIVGSRVDGAKGSVSGRFFWVNGSMMPVSSLSVGFDSDDGTSYILELPMSTITFVQEDELDPSVTVHLLYDDKYSSGARIEGKDCGAKFSWGFFHQKCEGEELVLDSSTEQQGLTDVVSRLALRGQLSITIVLSPEQYQEILTG